MPHVYLGAFDEHLGVDFRRSQRRRSVCCEERVAGAGAEDDHATSPKVCDGSPPDVRLSNLHETMIACQHYKALVVEWVAWKMFVTLSVMLPAKV